MRGGVRGAAALPDEEHSSQGDQQGLARLHALAPGGQAAAVLAELGEVLADVRAGTTRIRDLLTDLRLYAAPEPRSGAQESEREADDGGDAERGGPERRSGEEREDRPDDPSRLLERERAQELRRQRP